MKKDIAQEPEQFEALLYHQRLAHKAWATKAMVRGLPPSEQASALVWQLLVAYGEGLQDFPLAKEDVYQTAYELAALLLPELPMERMVDVYRDRLLDAIINVTENHVHDHCRALLGFSNLVSNAFADAQADLLRKASFHSRVQSLSHELKLAKRIQRHLLPKVIPTIPGFDFAGRLIPAEEIGGDYWSVKYKQKDGVVTLKLADITGHGVAAATLVAAVKFISGGYYEGAKTAAEVMQKTNRVLALETPHDILVTMVYGWLRPTTYEITLVNAGHSPVFLCQGDRCIDIPLTGPVLGVTEDSAYEEETFRLRRDDVLFFGSDGIIESGMPERFGIERLKKVVTSSAHLTADEIADTVVQAVTDFTEQPHDDISLLVVKVTGEPPEVAPLADQDAGK